MAQEHQETMGTMLWAEITWGVHSVDKSCTIEAAAFKAIRAEWEGNVCAYADLRLQQTAPPGTNQTDADKMKIDPVTRHCMRELGMAAALHAQERDSTTIKASDMQKAWTEAHTLRGGGGMGGVCM